MEPVNNYTNAAVYELLDYSPNKCFPLDKRWAAQHKSYHQRISQIWEHELRPTDLRSEILAY